ncbi:MFS transporter [Actinomadura rayongensis]|uniref:MFS transporter n=1 Tax=Actinomadura rayongensis TaxID=1429076 RepID=A0A6I4WP06_9ACTN|nr:MFS transporter [Actinomadura rayongensis]MXQ68332.1 MFS transporter [Actinomadura rayongensis]
MVSSATARTGTARAASPVVLVIVLLLAISAFQVAAMMITPALPSIGRRLDASPTQISLEQSLFFAIGGLTAAALPLSDRFGRHRMLAAVLALGVAGSVLVAVSSSLLLFDIGRWMQATGVIALPLSYLILRDHVPADRYPLYFGWLNALNTGITGFDGFIAGRMTDTVGYQGIFWIAAAVGAVALVCVLVAVPATAGVTGRTDWTGIATLGAGVVAISTGLAQSGEWGWTGTGTLVLLGAGLALVAAFVLVERASAHPLVRVTHLANRRVWGLALIVLVGMAGFMGATALLMPYWAQLPKAAGGFGLSATDYSLAILPGTFLAMCLAPATGVVARRVGWRPVLVAGTAAAGAGLVALTLTVHATVPAFVFAALVMCVFAGATMTAASGLGVLFSPAESPAFLPGIVSVMFSFGSSLGFAVGGSALARDTVEVPGAPPIPTEHAFTTTFALMAGLVVVTAVLTALVPRVRTAASPA